MSQKLYQVLFFIALLFLSNYSKADLIMEGERDISFEIINLNDFQDYEFYFFYQPYRYDKGYKKTEPVRTVIEAAKEYKGGQRGDKVIIHAIKKDNPNQILKSTIEVSGTMAVKDKTIKKVIQKIQVKKIKGTEIFLKIKDVVCMDAEGKEMKNESDIFLFDWKNKKFDGLYFLMLPVISGVIFVYLTRIRRRTLKWSPM